MNMEQLQDMVIEATRSNPLAKGRKEPVMRARALYMLFLFETMNKSAIARHLGIAPSTAVVALQSASNLLETDKEFKEQYFAVLAEVIAIEGHED